MQFTFLIGGTVIVERLFSYEGLGNMAIDAVINRDLPLIQGIVLVFALLFVLINLAVDMTVCAAQSEAAPWLTAASLPRDMARARSSWLAGGLAAAGRCWRRSSRRWSRRRTRWRRT